MGQSDVPTFGEQLRVLRETAGFTRDELAERAGLSAKAIGALERGERKRPYPHTVRALADALGLSEGERSLFVAAGSRRKTADSATAVGTSTASLPVPATDLVGRERELADLRELLCGQARLVTLVGAGGVGKTRLAIQVARELAGHFTDGVTFVSLAPLGDASLVLPAIARALGLPDSGPTMTGSVLHAYLQDRHLLLALDNVEHVLDAASDISELVATSHRLVVLATSRAPLRLRGEREYPVRPLALPGLDQAPDVGDLADNPAVRLFVDRARAIEPTFELTHTNARVVATICRRLDGLPLALELAAARIRVLDPTTMLARLDQALPLLSDGVRDLPERQRTMEAAIQWSYDILHSAERALFRRLAVFAGGWDLAAAEAIGVGASAAEDTLDLLSRLVEWSLVLVEQGERARYRMLEPVRQYALARLEEADAAEETMRRHAEYFVAFAERAMAELRRRARSAEWLESERDNLQAAVTWALAREYPGLAVRLAFALWDFWWERGPYAEVARWMEAAMHADDQLSPGELNRARFVAEIMRFRLGEHEGLASSLEEIAAAFEDHGYPEGAADALMFAGLAALRAGDVERAEALLAEDLRRFQTLGDERRVAVVLVFLGAIPLNQGKFGRAEELFARGLEIGRTLDDVGTIYPPFYHLALAAQGQGDDARAQQYHAEVLMLGERAGDKVVIGVALVGLAECAAVLGEAHRAARLFGAADMVFGSAGVSFHPFNTSVEFHERYRELARTQLGQEAFDLAWAEGGALDLRQVIATALELSPAS